MLSVKKNRLLKCCVSILRGVGRCLWRLRFYSGFYVRITPLLFDAFRQKEAACGILRFYSAHRVAGVERSQEFLRSSVTVHSLERVRFLHRRRGNGSWRCGAFCLLHISLALLCFPRGERWGCAPQTAPKSHWLSGLSSRCGGLGYHKLKTLQKATRLNSRTAAGNTRVL